MTPNYYHQLTTAKLMDLLAMNTQICTHHIAGRSYRGDYEEAKQAVLQIQAILTLRKQQEKIGSPDSSARRETTARGVSGGLTDRMLEKLKQHLHRPLPNKLSYDRE